MSWEIQIAYRDPDALVLDAIRDSRERLDETDAQIAEVIIRDALIERSITTVGELLAELGELDRAGTRGRLDWARAKLGLPSTGEVDKRREDFRFEAAFQRLQPPPPPKWSPVQGCPAKGCGARPTKPNGALREVDCVQWWCEKHRAGHEDDLKQYEPPYVGFTHSGRPIPSAKEKARLAKWAEECQAKEQRERRKREEFERREYEVIEEAKRRYADEGEISVLGIRTRPDLRIIRP